MPRGPDLLLRDAVEQPVLGLLGMDEGHLERQALLPGDLAHQGGRVLEVGLATGTPEVPMMHGMRAATAASSIRRRSRFTDRREVKDLPAPR